MGTPEVIRVPETACLECGHKLDAIGTAGGAMRTPRPGEAVVCIQCGAAMTFEDGRLRGFTDEEMEDLLADPHAMDDLARMVHRVHLVRHAQN